MIDPDLDSDEQKRLNNLEKNHWRKLLEKSENKEDLKKEIRENFKLLKKREQDPLTRKILDGVA